MAEGMPITGEGNVRALPAALLDELSRIEESAMYSSQGQHEQAKFWTTLHTALGVATAIVTATSGSLAFAQPKFAVLAGTLAVLGAIGAAVMTALNPQGRSGRAHRAANEYLSIQTAARQARRLHVSEADDQVVRTELEALTKRLDNTNHQAEQISRWAYLRAKANIGNGGQAYSVDLREAGNGPA